MRRWLGFFFVAALVLTGLPRECWAKWKGNYGVRLAYQTFNGDKDYWQDLSDNFDGDEKDFSGFSYGLYGTYPLTSFLEYGFGVSYYRKNLSMTSTKIFDINGDGQKIVRNWENDFTLEILPVQVIDIRVVPLGTDKKISPFVNLGSSITFWRYEEEGTFVIPDIRDSDRDGRTASSEIPDYILFENHTVDHESTYLSLELGAGANFSLHKNMVLTFGGRYSFINEQLNRDFEFVSVKEPATGEINIRDVQVNRLDNYLPMELGVFQLELTLLYRF